MRRENPTSESPANRGQAHIVDLGIRAPHAASGNANFEFAGQIVEVAVAHKEAVGFERQRRSIADFVGIHTGERAARDVAGIVATRAHRGQARAPQSLEEFRKVLNRDPVQLDILAHRQVSGCARIFLGDVGDGSQLVSMEQAVRNTDAHHEEREGLPFSVLAADHAHSITLGVNAPPAEICAQPFGRDGVEAFAGELADIVEPFPGIFLALQALDPLGFCFLDCVCHKFWATKKPTASGLHWRWV